MEEEDLKQVKEEEAKEELQLIEGEENIEDSMMEAS